ncbi:MAG: glycosyltransferase [Candidatus Omnitrophica bacterium]|nr:glycosyltransferase [Candidatus Omnitrophota bacterium]
MSGKVSVIIPSYNRKELLGRCLRSVRKQDYQNTEVIVIDDGSTDGTGHYLKDAFPEVKILRNNESLGPAYAKNQGIMNSDGQYLYFLDSDSELILADTISVMVSTTENDDKTGTLGGIAEWEGAGNVRGAYGRKVTWDGRSYPVFQEAEHISDANGLMPCDYVETCNCFVRREVAVKAGGFDPYYFYMGEDKEFGLRIMNLGYRHYFGVSIACRHHYDETVCFDRCTRYLRTKMRFAIKNKGAWFGIIMPLLDSYLFLIFYPVMSLINWLRRRFTGVNLVRNNGNPNMRPSIARALSVLLLYLPRVFWWNWQELLVTLRSRQVDFLSEGSMREYERARSGLT